MNLQTRYDLELEKDRLGDRLDREVTVFAGRACEQDRLAPRLDRLAELLAELPLVPFPVLLAGARSG